MTSDGTSWPLTWGPAEIRALLAVRRDSYESLGEHLGASGETVRRWAAGEQRAAYKELLRALDSTLAALEPWQRRWFAELCGRDDLAGWVTDESEETSDTRRDEFLRSMAALAALAPVEAFDRIAASAADRDARVDASLAAAHEDWADMLAARHYAQRSDVLVGPARQHADVLLRLLERPMSETVRRRLEAITVGACAQAGLLAWNLNDRLIASRYFAHARDVARDAGSDQLRARASAVTSVLHSPIPSAGRSGDSRRAVELLQRSVQLDAGLSWAHWWLATELAAASDEGGFFAAVKTASRLSEQSAHGDARGFFAHFTIAGWRTATTIGAGLAMLGRADEAVGELRVGMASSWPLIRVGLLCHTATARVLQGEPAQACHELSSALDLALDTGYAMGVERIRGVRARFPTTWSDLVCVAELDEAMRR